MARWSSIAACSSSQSSPDEYCSTKKVFFRKLGSAWTRLAFRGIQISCLEPVLKWNALRKKKKKNASDDDEVKETRDSRLTAQKATAYPTERPVMAIFSPSFPYIRRPPFHFLLPLPHLLQLFVSQELQKLLQLVSVISSPSPHPLYMSRFTSSPSLFFTFS